MSLGRASRYYVYLIIVPTIVITFLSFAVFWADTGSADPLGYGITVLVVVLLMQVSIACPLPSAVCSRTHACMMGRRSPPG